MKTITVMTYDDWCKAHRKTLKKMICDSICGFFTDLFLAAIIIAPIILMLTHFFLTSGY